MTTQSKCSATRRIECFNAVHRKIWLKVQHGNNINIIGFLDLPTCMKQGGRIHCSIISSKAYVDMPILALRKMYSIEPVELWHTWCTQYHRRHSVTSVKTQPVSLPFSLADLPNSKFTDLIIHRNKRAYQGSPLKVNYLVISVIHSHMTG